MDKNLKRLGEIKKEVANLYKEKYKIEQSIIDDMVENKEKTLKLNDDDFMTLKWVYDKKIDYNRMETIYPEVYEQGLMTTFSKTVALMSMDRKLFKMILDDCITIDPHYELEEVKKKGKWKSK